MVVRLTRALRHSDLPRQSALTQGTRGSSPPGVQAPGHRPRTAAL